MAMWLVNTELVKFFIHELSVLFILQDSSLWFGFLREIAMDGVWR